MLDPTILEPCWVMGFCDAISVKFPEEFTVPPPVVTLIPPVTAPGITMPTRLVPLLEITMAAVPPMVNAVGLVKFVPVIVTNEPTGPLEGLNDIIVGACANVLSARN